MNNISYVFIPLFLLLSGCAAHPIAEQTTGYDTVEIMERIRCEAKTAIKHETLEILKEEPYKAENFALAEALESPEADWHTKSIIKILKSKEQRMFYYRYIETGLALSFTFDILEQNKNSIDVDLLKAASGGTLDIVFKESDDHKRQSKRTFLVTEHFGHLLDDDTVCNAVPYDKYRRANNHNIENILYPITGSIGLKNLLHIFIQINREALLATDKNDVAPTLADTLMFTTTYIGSVNPMIAISAAGRSFNTKLASLTGEATRTDLHQVNVGLSLHPKTAPLHASAVGNRGTGLRSKGALLFGAGTAAFARGTISPSEQRAIDAITQQRIDNFLDGFGGLR